ncbi:MAG: hypothetical protein LBD87_06955 [Prevotellaceae bacterium]|jgi:hypothetical protein|nr:hypothetical protein [Prevotellaceae bacterium]
MENLVTITIHLANILSGYINLFLSSLSEGEVLLLAGSGFTLAFSLGVVAIGNITEGVMQNIRSWHGSIDDQFTAIDNLVKLIQQHQPGWDLPVDQLTELSAHRDELRFLIPQCRSTSGSKDDRNRRNSLLKLTVGLCLLQVRVWAYKAYTTGVLTADDVHQLGFLLPGESGGHHDRTEATDITAEVKVKVINEDFIRVIIDQSAGENAALVVHGWPPGVKNALIVITANDGKTEVYRELTTRLHNDIRLPNGSHGKQFIIKAAFLKHVNDEPRFGNEPTFSMPLTTEDLAAALDRQHHEDFEEQLREVERQRQEIERLQTELASKQ